MQRICLVCFYSFPVEQLSYLTCCGNAICFKCQDAYQNGDTFKKKPSQKSMCIICKQRFLLEGSEDEISRLTFRAERHNDPLAMDYLGDRFFQGNGVTQSSEKAFKWYTKAVELGNTRCIKSLAVMCNNGWINDDGTVIEPDLVMVRNLLGWAEQEEKNMTETPVATPGQTLSEESPSNEVRSCAFCSKQQTDALKLSRCACGTIYYCNTQCQTKGWKAHKKECKKIRKEQKKKKNGKNMKDGTKDGQKVRKE